MKDTTRQRMPRRPGWEREMWAPSDGSPTNALRLSIPRIHHRSPRRSWNGSPSNGDTARARRSDPSTPPRGGLRVPA